MSFGASQSFVSGNKPFSVAPGDFNDDNVVDLVTQNFEDQNATVFLGLGDGTFTTKQLPTSQIFPSGVAVGDLNGDTKDDLVVACKDPKVADVFLNNGEGEFGQPLSFGPTDLNNDLALGDLDGDSKLDIVLTSPFGGQSRLQIARGLGDGTFEAPVFRDTAFAPWRVVVADLNKDNRQDLVATNLGASGEGNSISVLLNSGSPGFSDLFPAVPDEVTTNTGPSSLAVGDLDLDGSVDVVTANVTSNNLSILAGNGDGSFKSFTSLGMIPGATGVVIADLNGDQKPDIAATSFAEDKVFVFLGNGDGSFAEATTFSVGNGPFAIIAVDLDGNGKLDLVTANQDSFDISVLLNVSP